ncbi:MAG TPA: pirin family protein [Geminicoccaceae bacterium]|nr:pirin family protein [Geminicoccus sp.]HMU51721.1 pirin family protein [Geminicoccaceae bacterium]
MRKVLDIHRNDRAHWVGDGFPVRSLFSHRSHGADVSPFLLADHAGPARFEPAERPRGVGLHPHRGFETVTIVYEGELEHADSAGNSGRIGAGDVQWMTAGRGILHEEFHSRTFTSTGGTLEMVQLWVNLPARHKMAEPGYQTLLAADIPTVELPEGAGSLRVIAGAFGDARGPARTFTPLDVWDLRLDRDGRARLELPEGRNVVLLVLAGTVLVDEVDVVRAGDVMVLDRTGGAVTVEANNQAKLLVLAGEPIDEPVAWQGPFVMSAADELRQAFADFESGAFGAAAA